MVVVGIKLAVPIRQRCAVGIPKEFLFLGIPRKSRDFRKGGGRNSMTRIKLIRTRIDLNQRIVALSLLLVNSESNVLMYIMYPWSDVTCYAP